MAEHEEAVKKLYACFGAGDVPGILAMLDPDVEWEHDWGTPPPPLYQPRRGPEEVRGSSRRSRISRSSASSRWAFLTGGDMVAVPIHLEGRHKATGKVIRDLEVHLWTFDADGRVTRLRHVIDARPFE